MKNLADLKVLYITLQIIHIYKLGLFVWVFSWTLNNANFRHVSALFILHFLPPISNPLISSLPFLPWYSVYSTPPFISTAITQMKLPAFAAILLLLTRSSTVQSFTIITNGVHNTKNPSATIIHTNKYYNTRCTSYYSSPLRMTIVSPFDNSTDDAAADESVATPTYTPLPSDDETLDLTWHNVRWLRLDC